MTRKKTLAHAIVNLPALVAETTLDSLPIADRDSIKPMQAARIAGLANTYAVGVAEVLERGDGDLTDGSRGG